jgi:D-psicose/D-tagatose/L-ribulose 3-epimerase
MRFDGFEIPMFNPNMLPVRSIRNAFEAAILDCTVCAILPKSFNPISPNREARRKAIAHLVDCVGTSVAMGATILSGPLFDPIGYLPKHRPTEDEWSWAAEAFQELEAALVSRKCKPAGSSRLSEI